MGQFTQVEVQSARGRADAVVKTPQYIYVFEFKLHDTAEAALKQIDEKDYLIPYQADGREVIKLGVEFSAEKRNINRWLTVMSYKRLVLFKKITLTLHEFTLFFSLVYLASSIIEQILTRFQSGSVNMSPTP